MSFSPFKRYKWSFKKLLIFSDVVEGASLLIWEWWIFGIAYRPLFVFKLDPITIFADFLLCSFSPITVWNFSSFAVTRGISSFMLIILFYFSIYCSVFTKFVGFSFDDFIAATFDLSNNTQRAFLSYYLDLSTPPQNRKN